MSEQQNIPGSIDHPIEPGAWEIPHSTRNKIAKLKAELASLKARNALLEQVAEAAQVVEVQIMEILNLWADGLLVSTEWDDAMERLTFKNLAMKVALTRLEAPE